MVRRPGEPREPAVLRRGRVDQPHHTPHLAVRGAVHDRAGAEAAVLAAGPDQQGPSQPSSSQQTPTQQVPQAPTQQLPYGDGQPQDGNQQGGGQYGGPPQYGQYPPAPQYGPPGYPPAPQGGYTTMPPAYATALGRQDHPGRCAAGDLRAARRSVGHRLRHPAADHRRGELVLAVAVHHLVLQLVHPGTQRGRGRRLADVRPDDALGRDQQLRAADLADQLRDHDHLPGRVPDLEGCDAGEAGARHRGPACASGPATPPSSSP